ncbi:MAG: multidrug ABC transporter permease [Rickettsiales bacterium]|nr:multidrug ABC transporter permease [Rickettsiales bacterium]
MNQPTLKVREFGLINWVGFKTLYVREVQRFMNVYLQTIIAPVITTLLFFAIFSLALGGAEREVWGMSFMTFLAPGLLMMTMVQNAFANPSSSLVISKIQGNIVDVLMPPLSNLELSLGWLLGSVTRGFCIGVLGWLALNIFYPVPLEHPLLTFLFGFLGCTMLSLLGIVAGIWADKFDHIASVTNFVVTPLTFLSGTFYSIDTLPETWEVLAHYNPFFYMIDGFRFGLIGQSDSDPYVGLIWLLASNAVLWFFMLFILKKGYKIKS